MQGCEGIHGCGVQPAESGGDILGVGVLTWDFWEVLGCGIQEESGSEEGLPGICVHPSWGLPVPWAWVSPLGEAEEVGVVLGDLGGREAPGELHPENWNALGIQTSLGLSVSPQ